MDTKQHVPLDMDIKRLPHRDLIQRLTRAEADDPLWVEFVSRFHARLRLVILRCFKTESERHPNLDVGSPVEAVEDLTQEVFLRLLDGERRALSRFEGRSEHSAYTYLSAIAANVVRDHFKKLRAQKTPKAAASLSEKTYTTERGDGPRYAEVLVNDAPGPERFVASRELRQQIRTWLAEVSPSGAVAERDRLVFQLFFIEGLTVDEIAATRSIRLSPSGVEKCLRRIRTLLKERLSVNAGR